MNEQQRDELLIRLDERTAASVRWEAKHEVLHRDEKTARWKIWAPVYAALVAVISKSIWWN